MTTTRTPLPATFAARLASFALAVVVTASMLSGIDRLSAADGGAVTLAQKAAPRA